MYLGGDGAIRYICPQAGGVRSSCRGARLDYEHLLSCAACGLFECEPDGTLRYANQAYAELTGLGISDLVGKRSFLSLIDSASPSAPGPQAWLKALAADQPFEQECVYQSGRGRRTVLQAVSPLPHRDGRRYVGVTMDVSDRADERRNAWYAAHHDIATRLPNLHLFEERLALLLRRRSVGVLSLGLEDIGAVPRAAGLPEWDSAVQIVAERLRLFAGADGLVAHVGAGEFLLALDSDALTEAQARVVLKRVSEPMRVAGRLAYPKITAGFYAHAESPASGGAAIRRAQLALAHARESRGNMLRVFETTMEAALSDRWSMAGDLAAAIATRRLHLDYQPEFDLAEGRMRVAEALVRWRHPRRGLVSPAEFIPVAESAGLIEALGAWVLESACRFGRVLQTRYVDAPHIAVNVSPLQFLGGNLADQVARVLERSQLAPERLELEITEGLLLERSPVVQDTLERLHGLGVRLVLDDFGTGFSSLAYLTRVHVHRLKIDRSFVSNLPHDARSLAIVTAVLGMARALSIEVTAEGIERAEQADLLRQLGCGMGQGYGLARPMSSCSLERSLKPRFGA